MRVVAFILATWACLTHGRTPRRTDPAQEKKQAPQDLNLLASMLMSANPTAGGFQATPNAKIGKMARQASINMQDAPRPRPPRPPRGKSNPQPAKKPAGLKPDDGRSIADFSGTTIRGQPFDFSSLRGKVVLVSDVASQTIMAEIIYGEFDELTQELGDQGFEVLAYPTDQFLNREGDSIEPGTAEEIEEFALSRAPKINLMEKTTVAGEDADEVWKWLQDRTETLWWGAEKIDWVFERFLVNRDGKVVNRYKSTASPEAIKRDIQKQLNKPAGAA